VAATSTRPEVTVNRSSQAVDVAAAPTAAGRRRIGHPGWLGLRQPDWGLVSGVTPMEAEIIKQKHEGEQVASRATEQEQDSRWTWVGLDRWSSE
jgi:hypothetical protein